MSRQIKINSHRASDGECFPPKGYLIPHLFLPLPLDNHILRFLQIIFLRRSNHRYFHVFRQVRRQSTNADNRRFQTVDDRAEFSMNGGRGVDGYRERNRIIVRA